MDNLVIPQDRAVYRILDPNGFYGPDDHLYREGDVIAFDECPNEQMEAMNDLARANLDKFFDAVDKGSAEAAAKFGRSFRKRMRIEDRLRAATAASRRVELVKGDGGVPIMGGDTGRKERIQRLGDDQVSQTGNEQPRRRGRPPGSGAKLALSV